MASCSTISKEARMQNKQLCMLQTRAKSLNAGSCNADDPHGP